MLLSTRRIKFLSHQSEKIVQNLKNQNLTLFFKKKIAKQNVPFDTYKNRFDNTSQKQHRPQGYFGHWKNSFDKTSLKIFAQMTKKVEFFYFY